MIDVFLGIQIVAKLLENALANYLKLPIDYHGKEVNYHSLSFFRIVKIAWHMIAFGTLDNNINAYKAPKCFYRFVVSL